jgi:5-methylcytosine-specific restriction endonuclease McrA
MSPQPLDAADALAMAQAGLSFLATCEAVELPADAQAEILAGLEGAEARLTAARSAVLAAFCTGHGYEADGQYGPKPWLRAFTRISPGAATGALAWMRRLQAHPAVAAALATVAITASWGREICTWTDRLPAGLIQDADAILLAAAAGGADLRDLALLATEMIERSAGPDDDDGGFADRALWLEKTLAGAGRLTGDLTPGCAAALTAVLEALGDKAGPEDTRSLTQRHHDALEEACHRLIAANLVPGRDGQPLHLYAHADLARLATAGAVATARSRAESRWSLARTVAGPAAWCPTGTDLDAAACDATIIPVTTGHVDWSLADDLISLALPAWPFAHDPAPPGSARLAPTGPASPDGLLTPEVHERLRQLVIQHATSLLSGPVGLAAQLRTRTLARPFTGRSQPLDVGSPTPVIPPHLRRAVNLRDQHCRFPGCAQPPSVCQVHHLIPRAHDGPNSLGNLALLCRFHHLTVIHRWNWILTCHADGTATAVSPDGRTLHSHSPPGRVA